MEPKTTLRERVAARITLRGPALGMQEQGKSLHPDRFKLHPAPCSSPATISQ